MKCRKIILALILLVALAVLTEFIFRGYLRVTGRDVIILLPPEEVLEKAWFKPHPHLLYIFKPNSLFTINSFSLPKFTINRFGFRSTLEYDVNTLAKQENTIRIATLGGSTTMGVNDDNKIWPYLLGKKLSIAFPNKKIEVLNEGIMGYTSLDNLLDLSMRIIDFNCDIYVIYLGVNDLLPAAPIDIYQSDHAHFRRPSTRVYLLHGQVASLGGSLNLRWYDLSYRS